MRQIPIDMALVCAAGRDRAEARCLGETMPGPTPPYFWLGAEACLVPLYHWLGAEAER
jgi:hypothetical protein